DRTAGIDGGVPAGDRSILGCKDEEGRSGLAALGNVKSARTVEDLPVRSRRRGLPRRRRNRYGGKRCKRLSRAVLERCQACTIVRYPEWPVRGERHAPRIDQIRIDVCRSRIAIRDQIGLRIRDQIDLRKGGVRVLLRVVIMVAESKSICVHGFLLSMFLGAGPRAQTCGSQNTSRWRPIRLQAKKSVGLDFAMPTCGPHAGPATRHGPARAVSACGRPALR